MKYQKLFNYMKDEHGVTLLESEMQEIARICEKQNTEKGSEIAVNSYVGNAMGYLNYHVVESLRKIVTLLESCNYENEAGYLKNNVAFIALKKLSEAS